MNQGLLIPTLAVALCGTLAALPYAWGENGSGTRRNPRSAFKIAVVDMGQILKHYTKAEELRQQVAASTDASNTKLKELLGKGQELAKTLTDGSIAPETSEFRDTETKVFQLESYVKTYKASAEKELQLEGARASLEVYNDIQETLKLFCEHNGFTAILRIDNDASAAGNPQLVARTLGQEIVFHRTTEDITNPVVAYLNRRHELSGRSQSAHDQNANDKQSSQKPPSSKAPPQTSRKSNSH